MKQNGEENGAKEKIKDEENRERGRGIEFWK